MDEKYFLVRVKRTNGTVDKGVEVKDNLDAAYQSYYAYLGAYSHNKDANTDYVLVEILNHKGLGIEGKMWERKIKPEPETVVAE